MPADRSRLTVAPPEGEQPAGPLYSPLRRETMTLRKSKRPRQVSSARQRDALAGVRRELPAWIGILENVRSGLLRAAASITPSWSEADPEVDLDKMDEPTELRSVLGNV